MISTNIKLGISMAMTNSDPQTKKKFFRKIFVWKGILLSMDWVSPENLFKILPGEVFSKNEMRLKRTRFISFSKMFLAAFKLPIANEKARNRAINMLIELIVIRLISKLSAMMNIGLKLAKSLSQMS